MGYLKDLKDLKEAVGNCWKSTIFDENGVIKGTPLKIQVKYLADIEPIKQIDGGDWIDLRAAKTVVMKKGDFYLIPLGIAIKLPEGYEAHAVPRSSTFKNFGIIQTNHMGIIDNSYCGNNDQWHFPAYALRDTEICKNDRICQFRIVRNQPKIVLETVDKLPDINRGGIGSTGIK